MSCGTVTVLPVLKPTSALQISEPESTYSSPPTFTRRMDATVTFNFVGTSVMDEYGL